LCLLQDFPSLIEEEEEEEIPSTFLGLCFNMNLPPLTHTAFLLAFTDQSFNTRLLLPSCLCFLIMSLHSIYFGHTVHSARSWFPDWGWNPSPLQWEHGVLTTGLPGKSLLSLLITFFLNEPHLLIGTIVFAFGSSKSNHALFPITPITFPLGLL